MRGVCLDEVKRDLDAMRGFNSVQMDGGICQKVIFHIENKACNDSISTRKVAII
jgi:hypothetical protein